MKTHPMRTLILLILTFAQAVCVFAGFEMLQGMRQELLRSEARLGADLLVYPSAAVYSKGLSTGKLLMQGTPVEVYKDRSMLSRMDSCDDISEMSYQIYISDTLASGDDIWIVGFEPETDFVLSPWVEDSESLSMQKGSVAVGSKVTIADNNTVTLYGKEWPVAAHLMETGSILDESVFVSMETLGELIQASNDAGMDEYKGIHPETDFSVALVKVTDRNRVESVTDWINIYVRKVTAVRSEETLTQAASGIRGTTRTMAVIAVLAWLILLFALGITQSMLMKERIKEIFVWHTIGASRSMVNRVMLTEALMIHLTGGLAGVLITWVVFALFGNHMISGFTFSAGFGLLAAFVSIAVTLAAGLAAAYLAIKRVMNSLNGQMLLTI